MGNPAIAIAGKFKADTFNAVSQVSFCLHLPSSLRFGFMVEAAPG